MTISAMSDPFDPLPFSSNSVALSPPHSSYSFSNAFLPELPALSPFSSSPSHPSSSNVDSYTSAPSPLLLSLVHPSPLTDFPSLPSSSYPSPSSLSSHHHHHQQPTTDEEEGEGDDTTDGGEEDVDCEGCCEELQMHRHRPAPTSTGSSVASTSPFSPTSVISALPTPPTSTPKQQPQHRTAPRPVPATAAHGHGHHGAREQVERRVSKACYNCSISKTKCDNNRPCGRCVRTDRTATCSDPVRKRRGRKRPFEDAAPPVSATPLVTATKVEPAPLALKAEPKVAVVASLPTSRPSVEVMPTGAAHRAAGSRSNPVSPASRSHPSTPSSQSYPLKATVHAMDSDHRHPSPYPAHSYPSQAPRAHAPPVSVHAPAHFPPPPQHSQSAPGTPVYSSPDAYHSHSSSSSTPSPPCCAPTPTVPRVLPISSMLSRLRVRLPSTLYRSFDAVVQQFHRWSDTITKAKQAALPPPHPVLKARQYVFHTLTEAMLYLEDKHNQSHSSPSPSPFPSHTPSPAEQHLLMTTIQREWGTQLYTPTPDLDPCVDSDDGGPLSLDALLHQPVVAPTFIIPLMSFPFFLHTPLISHSFATLLGYSHASLTSFVRTPLDLLSLRQYPDVSLLVPAFLSALSARADHYLHSSGWRRSNGEYAQLVAKVQLVYAPPGGAGGVQEGYPVALMATFQKQTEGSFTQHVRYFAQQGQGRSH